MMQRYVDFQGGSHPPPHRPRAQKGPGPRPHPGGPAQGRGHRGRDHRHHPRLQGRLCRGAAGRDHGPLRLRRTRRPTPSSSCSSGRLAGLEILKIEQELGRAARRALRELPGHPGQRRPREAASSSTTCGALADKYGDDRRTSIEAVTGEVDIEDLIPEGAPASIP